jgi:hypothetical protein
VLAHCLKEGCTIIERLGRLPTKAVKVERPRRRATLQVPGRVAGELLAAGNVEEVNPDKVPHVAER